ncbi:MAG: NAD-dependent epimerase/dehydratase family protein [Gemmatimonadetes bacterium]|nr:NAD-dependent epimerase/dehydratase family protein [Gemmatimonadota bacterium]
MRVFLTGGTGLVGSHTAERLLERGHQVVGLVRPGSERSHLESLGAALVEGDITDAPARLAGGMEGCDAVVHAAALVFRRASWQHYEAVNVQGTENVLRAAGLARASRVVHVSSVAVYRGLIGRARIREEDWRSGEVPARDVYARSKRRAEEVAWQLHQQGVVRLSTVRPSVIYGERDRLFTPILARLVSLPLLPAPAGGHAALPVVYAGNVADGVVAALERDAAVGRAYNLSEDARLTLRELVTGFGVALGRTPRLLPVPGAALLVLAWAVDALLSLIPGAAPNLRRGARLLLHGNPYVAERARRELGWGARVRPAEALARTAAWYCGAGVLPRRRGVRPRRRE